MSEVDSIQMMAESSREMMQLTNTLIGGARCNLDIAAHLIIMLADSAKKGDE